MSNSNDVSTLDHRPLADSELDAVSGGTDAAASQRGLSGDFRGRYQLRLDEAKALLS